MITNPVQLSDAVLKKATITPQSGGKSIIGLHVAATFTSTVAHAMGLEVLKDAVGESKVVQLKTFAKSFRAEASVPDGMFKYTLFGHEAKYFRLKFPEKEQPILEFWMYGSHGTAEWLDYARNVGTSPVQLLIQPIAEPAADEDGDTEETPSSSRIWPEREEDGSFPFLLAERKEYRTANADCTLFAIEFASGAWLYGYQWRAGKLTGELPIGRDDDGPIDDIQVAAWCSMADAFREAASDLREMLSAVDGTKKEREYITHIDEWLQPIIEGEQAIENVATDVAELVGGDAA